MNLDDPKLTAFALDELDEPEKSAIARAIANSQEAQRFVDETRELARALKKEYREGRAEAPSVPLNLSDIRDDPWFWSVARPLAIAAVITAVAIVGAITLATYKSHQDLKVTSVSGPEQTEIIGEETPPAAAYSDFAGPETIPSPVRAEVLQSVERVVIGELDPQLQNGEIHVIETIKDAYRVQNLKHRLATPLLSKRSHRWIVGGAYQLIFLDRDGHVVAAARFFRSPDFGYVLQTSEHGYESNGHYFVDERGGNLPGDWQAGVDYSGYVIPFSDWNECIGYSPGV